jgi:hypothetical protein
MRKEQHPAERNVAVLAPLRFFPRISGVGSRFIIPLHNAHYPQASAFVRR